MTDHGAKATVAIEFLLMSYAWLLLCLGTCTYLVFWRGHSGWWYLLAIVLASTSHSSDDEKKP